MIKLIGVPSEAEAFALYNNWKQERDDWNYKAKHHNTILICSVVCVCILVMAIIVWSFGLVFTFDAFGVIRILGLCCIPAIGLIIALFNLVCQRGYDEFFWPLKYKYYVITHDKTILDSRFENGVIRFVLENAKHEVSTDVLVGFKQKYRTDVDEIIADLQNEEILVPYKV